MSLWFELAQAMGSASMQQPVCTSVPATEALYKVSFDSLLVLHATPFLSFPTLQAADQLWLTDYFMRFILKRKPVSPAAAASSWRRQKTASKQGWLKCHTISKGEIVVSGGSIIDRRA